MNIPLYTQDGTKQGEVAVPKEIFGRKENKALIHRILLMQLANRRHPIAHTLTKGEVRGGGKKPYKQKHTGQARQGSITNPHYKGGGVAFGPRNTRNFKLSANKKERRNALFGTLSTKYNDGGIIALESFTSDPPKTKAFATMLKKLPIGKNALFILPAKNAAFVQASRNLQNVRSVLVNYLNIADVLNYSKVIFLKDAISKLEEIFLRS